MKTILIFVSVLLISLSGYSQTQTIKLGTAGSGSVLLLLTAPDSVVSTADSTFYWYGPLDAAYIWSLTYVGSKTTTHGAITYGIRESDDNVYWVKYSGLTDTTRVSTSLADTIKYNEAVGYAGRYIGFLRTLADADTVTEIKMQILMKKR